MTYASPTWEFAAETHLLKLQYIYDYITKFCRRQAEIIHNHESENVCNTGQGKIPQRKLGLNLAVVVE
jgi:hypothetical protein